MAHFIQPADLTPFVEIDEAKAAQMIADAEATAVLIAPCLPDLTVVPDGEAPAEQVRREFKLDALKAILRGAILRWEEAGSGATQTQVTGPFSQTTQYQARRGMFWPSELENLQALCKSSEGDKAFTIDTAPGCGSAHVPWCSVMFGGSCSCGVDIAGVPIYEGGAL